MKPVFGIDITTTKKNKFFDGKEFVVATVSEERANSLKQAKADIKTLKAKANVSLPIMIFHWICAAVALIAITMFFDTTDHVGFKNAYYEKPLLFWLGVISIIVWFVLNIIYTNRFDKISKSEEGKQLISRIDLFEDSCYSDLFVPSNAINVDIISFTYKVKNSKPIAKMNDSNLKFLTPYRNLNTKIFVKNEHLYIADTENKYAFSLSEMSRIQTIKKSIPLPEWNKEIPYNKGIYKPYKMDYYGGENLLVKPYHVLELEHNGETWGIYFPCYELPVFEELTGLKAEQ